ncbi:MAG TPA: hypothetical protein VHU40_05045, partial [Polyangia bacterium]|nr:hypothetical protein [Polyangia bacterium]
ALSLLFRDAELSNDLGFHLQTLEPDEAAAGWVAKLKRSVSSGGERVVTVVLDGENAWGAYRDDGRPFLHALYTALLAEPDLRTVTPSELLDGNPARGVAEHRLAAQYQVHDLFTGSWIDEPGTPTGVDLGTWIGEAEENRAWELLGRARRELADAMTAGGATRTALLAAEGSDWFWWLGDDQDSGHDPDFEALFRQHLRDAYQAAGAPEPAALRIPLLARAALWTFARPLTSLYVGDSLVVRTYCPGALTWTFDAAATTETTPMVPVGGVMAGTRRHQARIGPFLQPGTVELRFGCQHAGPIAGDAPTCQHPTAAHVTVLARAFDAD